LRRNCLLERVIDVKIEGRRRRGIRLKQLPDDLKETRRCWTLEEEALSRALKRLWGKYELRPAVKKLYQLRPSVSASRVSVASRVVSPKHDELRFAVSEELYQLCPKVSASRV